MDDPLALVLFVSVLIGGAFLGGYFLRRALHPIVQASPPQVIEVATLFEITQLIDTTVTNTAKAIGEAVAASLTAPPVHESPQEAIDRVAHELAEDIYKRDFEVDDSDPTDVFLHPERTDAAPLRADDPAPFGVPGVRADLPELDPVPFVNPLGGE